MSPELRAFLASWSWEPSIVLALLLAAALYTAGWRQLARRGRGRAAPALWRAWCYAVGLAVIALALLSPIATYVSLFFFMHMIQHLLLIMVAPPLLWLGAPLLPVLWGLPADLRRGVGRLFARGHPVRRVFHVLTHPLVACGLYLVVVAFWHLPTFYDAAQGRTLVHDLEHLTFLGTGLLYWWPIVHPAGGRRRLGYFAAIVYLFPPLLEGNLIGALLTFATQPVYATYQRVPRIWGLSVLDDQQLGGLIMWVPAGMMWLIPLFVMLTLALQQEERTVRRLGGAGHGPADGSQDRRAHAPDQEASHAQSR